MTASQAAAPLSGTERVTDPGGQTAAMGVLALNMPVLYQVGGGEELYCLTE